MITELFLNTIFLPLKFLINLMPVISLNFDFSNSSFVFGLATLLSNIAFLDILPVKEITCIITAKILLRNARIIWAGILRVKSFIIGMGN